MSRGSDVAGRGLTRWIAAGAVMAWLTGCALPLADSDMPAPAGAEWRAVPLPGKAATRYVRTSLDGRSVLHARADRSASMWRHVLRIEPVGLGRLHFSWKVPRLIEGADLRRREGDDTPVRLVLAFDGDRQRLSMRDRMLFDLAESLTGEAPPYATLMYVWDPQAQPGTVIPAPRSDRVRGLVVESGPQRLGRWLHYERDVAADFQQVFGEAPGALIGVAVMTDSDNTGTQAEAFYGGIEMQGSGGRLRLL